MTDNRPPYPEVLPDETGLVSPAVGEILATQFRDKLDWGVDQWYPHGTHRVFEKDAKRTLDAACKANEKGELTQTHLLLAATFHAVSQRDVSLLRAGLVALAAGVIDWIEQIDSDEDDE